MCRSNLSGSTLAFADLTGADLRDAVLDDVDLSDARLDGADLRGAVLRGGRLQRSSLAGTRLDGATVECTYLQGADFTGSDISQLVLRDNEYDSSTCWPTSAVPPASVPVVQDDIGSMDLPTYLASRRS